jgi:hypothetical protein
MGHKEFLVNVLNETAANYEAFFWMRIKISNLNILKNQAKTEKLKNCQHKCRKY